MHVYTFVCVCVYLYAYIPEHAHAHTQTHIYMHVCVYEAKIKTKLHKDKGLLPTRCFQSGVLLFCLKLKNRKDGKMPVSNHVSVLYNATKILPKQLSL